MTDEQIREAYESGRMTWADLLEVTGLAPFDLYPVLFG